MSRLIAPWIIASAVSGRVQHEELKRRGSEAVPERPDELSKMVLAIAERGTWLEVERGWGKKGGDSCRKLLLRFKRA